MSTRHPWLSWLVLALLLGVALALRWRYIREISLFIDEFVTAWAARQVLEHGLPLFPSGNIYPHGLLFTYLAAPFVLGDFDETVVRIPGLLVGLAALPAAYLVGRRLFSETAGLVAAAAMAVDPDFIIWGGRARMYGLLQLLVLLAVYIYYRGLAGDRPRDRLVAMVLLVAAIFTHLEAAFLLPVLGLATLLAWGWRRLPRRDTILPFVVGGAGAIAFVLLAKYGQPNHLETMEREGRGYVDLSTDLLSGPLAFAPVFTAPHRLVFGLLALAGLFFVFRPRLERQGPLAYVYVVLGGVLGLLVTLAGATWQRERYLFLVLPLLFLVGGEVLGRLARLLPLGPRLRPAVPAVLAVVVAAYVGLAGAGSAYVQEWGYDRAFRYLQEHWQPEAGDQIVTSMSTAAMLYLGRNDAFAIQQGYEEYVVNRPGDGLPADLWTATPVLTTTAALTEKLATVPRLWFVTDGWRFQTRYEPDFILEALAHMEPVYNERGVLIFAGQGYTPLPAPAVERARAVAFGDDLALAGFGLSAAAPAPGDDLDVTLHWSALPGAGPGYTAFLHLVAADGSGVAGVDEPVLRGLFQPDLWPRDRSLPDHHRLHLPAGLPPGRYRLDLGLYPSAQPGALLAVGQGSGAPMGDRLPLAALDVGRQVSPPPAGPAAIDLGPIRLLGSEVDCAGEPGTCHLVLYWQATRPPDRDYTVLLHLLDAAGTIVDQDDAHPGSAFFPTTTWLPGQVVRDEHSLSLPAGAAAGTYRLVTGLYHLPTGERLPATDAAGRPVGDVVPLASVDLAGTGP